jgi:hypothetical protein
LRLPIGAGLACISLAWKHSSHPLDREPDEPITSAKKSVHDFGFWKKNCLAPAADVAESRESAFSRFGHRTSSDAEFGFQ